MNLTDRIVVGLVRRQRIPVLGWLIRGVLHWRGTEVQTTDIGPGFRLMHGGIGVVIHSKSKIGSNVMIFQSVTVGRGDPWRPWSSRYSGFVLEDDVILCAGAVVANSSQRGVLTVGAGTVVGANSVLTQSTGEREIWAGSPARCVGHRDS
jgi:serine O-acetyltransferase